MSVNSPRMYTAPVPKMPPGIVELMEGLAKDVLKCNPPDVYSFCADHMKKLIEIRDGPTPKRVLTLDHKIATATTKIRERALRRRKDYDNEMQTRSEIKNDEGSETIDLSQNNSDAGQYTKDKIVIIPEKDLIGDVEHEIIVKIKENTLLSGSVKSTEMDTDLTLEAIKTHDNALLPKSAEESTKMNDVREHSETNLTENIYSSAHEKVQENELNEKKNIEIDQIDVDPLPNNEENCFEPVSDTQNSNAPLIINQSHHECETSSNKYNIDTQINTGDLNNSKEIINGSTEVGEQNYIYDCEEKDSSEVINSNNKNAAAHTDIGMISNKDLSLNIFDAQENDISLPTLPLAMSDEDDTLSANNIESSVNNTSMDLETAAITIQKVFRNFLFKNKSLSTDDATNVDINSLIEDKNDKDENEIISSIININKDRRSLGLGRIDTVLQTVNEEKSLSQSTDDSSTLSSAATIIQAHVRGFLTRNKFNLKNSSTTSGIDSDGFSLTSIDGDNEYRKNKTVLNIHIVPESGHFISRDESVLTSIDLSLDGSPPSSTNLQPLGYERNERRKQLRREDAIQSISPPSNNSGKSEEIDSIKEILINKENNKNEIPLRVETGNTIADATEIVSAAVHYNDVNDVDTALEVKSLGPIESPVKYIIGERPQSLPEMTADEMDVITPFTPSEEKVSSDSNLIHSGEFHEVLLPTKVTRGDTSVVREFKNVLVYFLLWNNA
ncbi:jg19338 [Pararge aegeria aegeria]|uniref:Jg19338 protein n=1 Tax=Pararge aegeria aegeria TaxID=348720 RepID=A0A8S4RDB4_9NEOP|nr:jg19338 [Pararge aegeria aegeria]